MVASFVMEQTVPFLAMSLSPRAGNGNNGQPPLALYENRPAPRLSAVAAPRDCVAANSRLRSALCGVSASLQPGRPGQAPFPRSYQTRSFRSCSERMRWFCSRTTPRRGCPALRGCLTLCGRPSSGQARGPRTGRDLSLRLRRARKQKHPHPEQAP